VKKSRFIGVLGEQEAAIITPLRPRGRGSGFDHFLCEVHARHCGLL
jgi:hypothetical protein